MQLTCCFLVVSDPATWYLSRPTKHHQVGRFVLIEMRLRKWHAVASYYVMEVVCHFRLGMW